MCNLVIFLESMTAYISICVFEVAPDMTTMNNDPYAVECSICFHITFHVTFDLLKRVCIPGSVPGLNKWDGEKLVI